MTSHKQHILNTLRLAILITASLALPVGVSAQRTTQKPLRLAAASESALNADTICGAAADTLLLFSGYEKTLRASKETIFVTNRSAREVHSVTFTVTYLDAQGRQLHRRRVEHHLELPAGETRRIDFATWDPQRTSYYSGGPRPRVSAIPYTVTITEPLAITLAEP